MSAHPVFALNARFLTQPVTGVQRYARNVTAALDAALTGGEAPLLAPAGAPDLHLQHMPLQANGPLRGHAWEQATLPARWRGRLLNLCNTGPALKADQVVCIHDANVFERPDSYGRTFRELYRVLQPLIAQRAARIATVSSDSARQLARHLPVRSADVAILPNGHEHALAWNPAASHLGPLAVAGVRVGSDRPFVLAIGSHARHKNMALLLEIAPALAEAGISMLVVGGKAGIFAVEDLRSAPNLRVLGRVSDDDLAYLMDEALCLAFPSWTEGFGLPALEAMARGCPVVSSDRASMPEVCGDAALMAAPNDPSPWVAHIGALAASPALRAELAGRGRERALRFSWTATAAGYLELMNEPSTRLRPPRVAVVISPPEDSGDPRIGAET